MYKYIYILTQIYLENYICLEWTHVFIRSGIDSSAKEMVRGFIEVPRDKNRRALKAAKAVMASYWNWVR